MRAIRSLLFIISLAYVSDTITYMGAAIACHVRMCAYICETGPIFSSHTIFHHRAYIRIYPIPYLRNNHVIFKMWLCPHGLLCINKNWYEITRKKVRHFLRALCYYHDSSIYISIMTSITALIITSLLIIVIGNTVNIDNIRD